MGFFRGERGCRTWILLWRKRPTNRCQEVANDGNKIYYSNWDERFTAAKGSKAHVRATRILCATKTEMQTIFCSVFFFNTFGFAQMMSPNVAIIVLNVHLVCADVFDEANRSNFWCAHANVSHFMCDFPLLLDISLRLGGGGDGVRARMRALSRLFVLKTARFCFEYAGK